MGLQGIVIALHADNPHLISDTLYSPFNPARNDPIAQSQE